MTVSALTRRQEIWDNVMSGKWCHRDWFDYAGAGDRVAVAEVAMRGPSSKIERDMLECDKCPMGNWLHEPRSVKSRLPVWC